ncbi:MAG: DUF2231 domain-containing protein [Chromatiaceae bacterium]
MIDAFYDLLDKIGYLHPIHPAMTHMPIGLVVGSLFIGAAALIFSHTSMARSAYYTLVLALIFWFPTVTFGLMDWQRYYGGAWLLPIKMKLILASVLFVLLVSGVLVGYRDQTRLKLLVPIYLLCFVTVTGLGYFGGQLVYGGRTPSAPVEFRAGEHVFDSNCSGCHAHGGNAILPNFPLRSAPELGKLEDFRAFIRDPRLPSGAKGPMPVFPPSRISDKQAHELYEYITNVIEKPSRK